MAASATCRFLSEFRLQFDPCGFFPKKRAEAEAEASVDRIQLKNNRNKEKEKAWLSLESTISPILNTDVRKQKHSAVEIQTSIDRGVQSFRFLTLVPVAGSLIGSVLCFLHGCFLVVESFLECYGGPVSHQMYGDDEDNDDDAGETMQLLVEAVDMYLLGSRMLNFGFGMYVVFVSCSGGVRRRRGGGGYSCGNQIGRAVVMMLQAGTVEKLKNVPMVTGVDLVCFAGALFVLSKLDRKKKK